MTVAANATEDASDPVSMGADELIGRYATEEQEPSLNPNAFFGNSELLSPPPPPVEPLKAQTTEERLAAKLVELNESLIESLKTTKDLTILAQPGDNEGMKYLGGGLSDLANSLVQSIACTRELSARTAGAAPAGDADDSEFIPRPDSKSNWMNGSYESAAPTPLEGGLLEVQCMESIRAFHKNQAQPFKNFVEGMRNFASKIGRVRVKDIGNSDEEANIEVARVMAVGESPNRLTPYMRVGALKAMAAHLARTWDGVKSIIEASFEADYDGRAGTGLAGLQGEEAAASLGEALAGTDRSVAKLLKAAKNVASEWSDPCHLKESVEACYSSNSHLNESTNIQQHGQKKENPDGRTTHSRVIADYGMLQDEENFELTKSIHRLHFFRCLNRQLSEGLMIGPEYRHRFNDQVFPAAPLHDPSTPVSPRRQSTNEIDVVRIPTDGDQPELNHLRKLSKFRENNAYLSANIESKRPPPPTPMEPYFVPWYYVDERCAVRHVDHAAEGLKYGMPPPPLVPKGENNTNHLFTSVTIPARINMPHIDVAGADECSKVKKKQDKAKKTVSLTSIPSRSSAAAKAQRDRLGRRYPTVTTVARKRIASNAPMNFNLTSHEMHGRMKPDHLRIFQADRWISKQLKKGKGSRQGDNNKPGLCYENCDMQQERRTRHQRVEESWLHAALSGPLPQTEKLVEQVGNPSKIGASIAVLETTPIPAIDDPHVRMNRPSYPPAFFSLEKQHLQAAY